MSAPPANQRRHVPRSLSDILGIAVDASLRVTGLSVSDGVVAVTYHGVHGTHVKNYHGNEGRRVAAELAALLDERAEIDRKTFGRRA